MRSLTINTHPWTILLSLLLTALPLFAQTPDTLWTRVFGGTDNDEAKNLQQTSDGGYIICGYTESFGNGSSDVWLIKTDEFGNEQWNRTYGQDLIDKGNCAQETPDGGFIMFGELYTSNVARDYWLVKTDSAGTQQWNVNYDWGGEYTQDMCYSGQQTADGGYIMAGAAHTYIPTDGWEIWIIKTDSYGLMEWDRTLGGGGLEWARCIRQTDDGGYIVLAITTSFGVGDFDIWLIKLNQISGIQWSRLYSGPYMADAWCVQQTTDGGYVIAGQTDSMSTEGHIWLIKTDSLGQVQWDRIYGEGVGLSVRQTYDGGYIMTATDAGVANIIKTNSLGQIEWTKPFDGSGIESFNDVRQLSDGGYIAAGYTSSYGSGGRDVWLIRLGGTPPNPKGIDDLAISIHNNSIILSWSPVFTSITDDSIDITHYKIYKSPIDPHFVPTTDHLIGIVEHPMSYFLDANALSDTCAYYNVKAIASEP